MQNEISGSQNREQEKVRKGHSSNRLMLMPCIVKMSSNKRGWFAPLQDAAAVVEISLAHSDIAGPLHAVRLKGSHLLMGSSYDAGADLFGGFLFNP